jgi:hypothetical protein
LSLFGRGSLIIAATAVLATASAWAEDLDARKTGPQLFEQTCSACHRSPHGLAKNTSASSLVDFLRQHYTTGPGPAGQLAAYLIANPGDGRARPAAKPEAPGERQRGAARQAEPNAEQPAGHRGRAQRAGRKPAEGQGNEPAAPVARASEGAPGRAEASPGKRQGAGEDKPAAAEAPASTTEAATPTATAASADASATRPSESGDQSAFSSPTP